MICEAPLICEAAPPGSQEESPIREKAAPPEVSPKLEPLTESGLQPSPTDASFFQEDEVDWTEESCQTEESAPDQNKVFDQLCGMLRDIYFKRRGNLLEIFSPVQKAVWNRVRQVEDDFFVKVQNIHQETLTAFRNTRWQSHNPGLTNPHSRGVNHRCFLARSQDQEEMLETEVFQRKDRQMKELYFNLYESLMETFSTPEFQGRAPEWLPLSPFSVKALSHGSQPSRFPGPISYADLMLHHGFIQEGSVRGNGRVPSGKTCKEKPLAFMSEIANIGTRPKNAWWWIAMGGFSGPNQFDCQGMCAVFHAILHSLWSKRAAYAAMELIPLTDLELLNKPIDCEERLRPGVCVGYTAVHLCSSGADHFKERKNIMNCLIAKKVDVNKKTLYHPHTTAAILASSQGCTEVLELLANAGADMRETNDNGVGIRYGAQHCSTTTAEWCEGHQVPELQPHGSGRTRNDHVNDSRLLRYAARWSYNQHQKANEQKHSGMKDHGGHGLQPSSTTNRVGYDQGAWQHAHTGWNHHGAQQWNAPASQLPPWRVPCPGAASQSSVYPRESRQGHHRSGSGNAQHRHGSVRLTEARRR